MSASLSVVVPYGAKVKDWSDGLLLIASARAIPVSLSMFVKVGVNVKDWRGTLVLVSSARAIEIV